MKPLILILLCLNLMLGVILVLGGPVHQTHEPGRVALQVLPDQFHLLNTAALENLRQQTQAQTAANDNSRPSALPQVSCIWVQRFTSEAMARRVQSKLAAVAGAAKIRRTEANNEFQLKIEGLDAEREAAVQKALEEFPRLTWAHCISVAP